MEESQLQGGLSFYRLMLSQPELRLVDLCNGITINKIIAQIDKRPTVKQCELNPSVSGCSVTRWQQCVSFNPLWRLLFTHCLSSKAKARGVNCGRGDDDGHGSASYPSPVLLPSGHLTTILRFFINHSHSSGYHQGYHRSQFLNRIHHFSLAKLVCTDGEICFVYSAIMMSHIIYVQHYKGVNKENWRHIFLASPDWGFPRVRTHLSKV